MLLLGLVLLSGCTLLEKTSGDPEPFSHRPPLVLLANKDNVTMGRANVTIEMNEIAIGAVSVKEMLKMADDWRLLVYTLDRDLFIDGNPEFNTIPTLHLKNLPLDTLLVADLEFHPKGSSKDVPGVKSFPFLVHVFPESKVVQMK